jgi:RimJ/RimL family protein N-acetyltransferase
MVLQHYFDNLSSNRLFFRKFTYEDIESWTDFYENNPNLQYLGIDLNRTNYEMAKAWIETQLARYSKNEFGQLAMISKETGELIGSRGFSFIEIEGKNFLQSMGSIKPAYWRQGFASEGAVCLSNFIFQNQISDSIISICHLNNWVSQQYLEKLGFVKQELLFIGNRNVFLYVLTKENWQNKQSIEYNSAIK